MSDIISNAVFVQVASEDETYVVVMSKEDAERAKQLLQKSMRNGEWNDEVNTILDRSKRLSTIGTINTMGDGFGWYKPEKVRGAKYT